MVKERLTRLRTVFGRLASQRLDSGSFVLRAAAVIICLAILIMSVMQIYDRARPIALGALENVVGGYIEETVIRAVRQELEENSYSWDDFCTKIVGEDGSIASISANTSNISVMCASVISRINSHLEDEDHIDIKIPIGSIIAPDYLSGKGFNIRVRAVPYVCVSAEVSSDMSEAGINQTLHRIVMIVKADTQAICMSDSVSFVKETRVILAESLIVGKIPIVS